LETEKARIVAMSHGFGIKLILRNLRHHGALATGSIDEKGFLQPIPEKT